MSEITDKFLTLKALAEYSSMPVPTIRDYLRRDGLPHFKLRGKILVKRTEFDTWLEKYRVEGNQLSEIANQALASLKGRIG